MYRDGARDLERVEVDAFGTRTLYIRRGEELISCDEATKSCRRTPEAAGAVQAFGIPGLLLQVGAGLSTSLAPASGAELYTGTREYLGERLQCFLAREEVGSEAELCFTEDGIPAYWRLDRDASEPVRIEREFDDSVFEPPYPVTD